MGLPEAPIQWGPWTNLLAGHCAEFLLLLVLVLATGVSTFEGIPGPS